MNHKKDLIDEESLKNAENLFSTLENKINNLNSKLKPSPTGDSTDSSAKFELIDRNDLKQKLNELISNLLSKDLQQLKKYLLAKSNPSLLSIQETCVRLLTLCVQHSFENAKQIAAEFDYFNETKNWLEKYLLMKNSDIREMSIEFLLSFLKFIQNNSSFEHLTLVKKILLKQDQKSMLTLINCLFTHISSDSKQNIEVILQEFLFGIIQNDSFTKSEKIRIFNEKILSNLIKIYEWSENDSDEEKLKVREMINEFLKVLFCSTRFGINFYDKSLGIDSNAKNLNHLIFNTLISLPRHGLNTKKSSSEELGLKTNELVDELCLRTFKVCPDLMQRFLKVKLKQAGDDLWIFKFMCRVFEQQTQFIKSMLNNYSATTCYLRSLVGAESEDYLSELIVNTSIPVCFSYQKAFGQDVDPAKLDLILQLLISSLNCVKEWKECLKQLDEEVSNEQDSSKKQIKENVKRLLENSVNFDFKLNLELLSKYFPKFDVFTGFEKKTPECLSRLFDIFGLYIEIVSDSINFMEIETLESKLTQQIPVLLALDKKDIEHTQNGDQIAVCSKYLVFLIKLNELKFRERVNFDEEELLGKTVGILVEIMRKFHADDTFKTLVEFYIQLFRVFASPTEEYIKFDRDFVYLWLLMIKKRYDSSQEGLNEFVKEFLLDFMSFKRRNSILLEVSIKFGNEIENFQFNHLINLINLKFYQNSTDSVQDFIEDYFFSSSLVYVDKKPLDLLFNDDSLEKVRKSLDSKINLVKELFIKKKKVQLNQEEKIKIKTLTEAYMHHFRTILTYQTAEVNEPEIKFLNFSLRSRHLIYLMDKLMQNEDGFDMDRDFSILTENLLNCLRTAREMKKLGLNSEELIGILMNNSIFMEKAFVDEKITKFLIDSVELVDNIEIFKPYLEKYLSNLTFSEINSEFILKMHLDKESFYHLINKLFNQIDLKSQEKIKLEKERIDFICKLVLKNKSFLFESDLNLFEELNALSERHFKSIDLLSKCLRFVLLYGCKIEELEEGIADFLKEVNEYQPVIFKLQIKMLPKVGKSLKKILASLDRKVEESTNEEVREESQIKLLEMYEFTLSNKDIGILGKLKKLDPSLNCLIFRLTNQNQTSNDILNKQTKIADFITLKLNETMLTYSIHNFPLSRKLDQLESEFKISETYQNDKIYDPVYLLPNIYNLLDYANVVDVIQFVQSKCLSYLLASLSSECEKIRSLAYGSIYRFVSHLENSRVYFKNILIYLVTLLRNSLEKENQKISCVVTVFLAEAVPIIVEPGSVLYKPLVSFLLLKPVLDLNNVPEFYKLFNSSSFQYKQERKWILNILASSCRTSVEYRLYEKRFVYRQLLSIYDSKMSDLELKTLILNLLLRTCECKFALIDLVRKHYFLIWMTSVLESNHFKHSTSLSNESNVNLFIGLIKIYNLIWKQLGKSEIVPLTFLNQMYILMKLFLEKMTLNSKYVMDMLNQRKEKDNIDIFFVVNKELIDSLNKYEFAFVKFEKDNLAHELKNRLENFDQEEFNFNQFIDLINNSLENSLNNNKRKIDSDQSEIESKDLSLKKIKIN